MTGGGQAAPSQSPAPSAVEMRAWDIAESITGPCTCIDAYKGRGLIAPDCAWHHMAEDIAAALLSEHDPSAPLRQAQGMLFRAGRLTEENARLREALAPFARIVPSSFYGDPDNERYSVFLSKNGHASDFSRADLLRARAALNRADRKE